MPRDYKHRANRRQHSKRTGVSPWLGVVTGLIIGLFVAFLVFIRMQPPSAQQVYVQETLPAPQADVTDATGDADKDAEESGPATQQPRFVFYSLLPEMEVVVPEQEITGEPEQGVRQVEKPGTYYLQVGSFRNGEQADRFKAELALLGLETSIQKVTIDNGGTFHRVRVGPYDNLDKLNRARGMLSKQDIQSTLVKIRE